MDRTNVLLEHGGGAVSGSDSEEEHDLAAAVEAGETQKGDVMSTILRLDPSAKGKAGSQLRQLAGQRQRYAQAFGRRRRHSAGDKADGERLLGNMLSEVEVRPPVGSPVERRRRKSTSLKPGIGGVRRRRHSASVAPL